MKKAWTAEVRFGSGPWKIVDREGFDAWLANVQKSGSGSAQSIKGDSWEFARDLGFDPVELAQPIEYERP